MRLRELSEFTEEQLQNLDQGLWDESIDVLQMIEGELKKPEIMNPAILRAEGEEEARGDVVKKATIEADSSGPIASDDPNTSGGNEEVDDSNDGEAVNSEMEGVEPSVSCTLFSLIGVSCHLLTITRQKRMQQLFRLRTNRKILPSSQH